MRVIGFNLDKISAERMNPPQGKFDIVSNINVKSISQEKIELLGDQPVLKFEFDFVIDYTPKIAKVMLTGNVILVTEKDQAKDILKKWKTNELSQDVKMPLFNLILTKCNLRTLQLEEELALPTHIPFPQLAPEKPADEKNSKDSKNKVDYTG